MIALFSRSVISLTCSLSSVSTPPWTKNTFWLFFFCLFILSKSTCPCASTLANNTSYFNVEWDFGDASPIVTGERVSHQYFADGTYTVTVYVYNASGCFTTATQEIIVGKGYTILMPNAFSPNGDNINEIIGPVFTGLKAVDFFVYNKLGILIYQESVSETNLSAAGTIEINGWDGTNSDPASNFYVYKIIGVRLNDEVVTKTGTIFLIE